MKNQQKKEEESNGNAEALQNTSHIVLAKSQIEK